MCVELSRILRQNAHVRVSSGSLVANPKTTCERLSILIEAKFQQRHTVGTPDGPPEIVITSGTPTLGVNLRLSWCDFIACCPNIREWAFESSDLLFVRVPWTLFVRFVLLTVRAPISRLSGTLGSTCAGLLVSTTRNQKISILPPVRLLPRYLPCNIYSVRTWLPFGYSSFPFAQLACSRHIAESNAPL